MDWEMPDDDELSDYGLPQDHKVFAWNEEGYSVSVREWIVRHAAGLSPLTPITLWPLREENLVRGDSAYLAAITSRWPQ
jgi:hypothetical protein